MNTWYRFTFRRRDGFFFAMVVSRLHRRGEQFKDPILLGVWCRVNLTYLPGDSVGDFCARTADTSSLQCGRGGYALAVS
jgi:hypothetical protein